MRKQTLYAAFVICLSFWGCQRQSSAPSGSAQSSAGATTTPQQPTPEQSASAQGAAQPLQQGTPSQAAQPPTPPPPIVVPAGTVLTVNLLQAVGSKTSQEGEAFKASLASSIVIDSSVAVPKGSKAYGTVTEAHPAGKFKGAATLGLTLDRLVVHGTSYTIRTAGVEEESKGKGKRTAGMVGGGAAGGALIGGLAGGGKGAAIGAVAGAGAGTAGAAFTGNNRDIALPAETAVKFKLTDSITVQPQAAESPN